MLNISKNNFIILIYLIIKINHFINSQEIRKKNIIHFIKCGYDSILIEGNGRYGLIDSSNNYEFIENEVEKVKIDEYNGEINQWTNISEYSVQAVLDYLQNLNVSKLDFVVGTHAHNDHIGGIPAIAYKYVDDSTVYYYKKYRKNLEDIIRKYWANEKYYLAAVNSMAKKNAQLVDVTNKIIKFTFGDMNIELLNTNSDPNEFYIRENKNSIVTLIKYKNAKVFLASDMKIIDDKKIRHYIGKINVLKLAHHGYSETSPEFLQSTKPDHIVITSHKLFSRAKKIIKYTKARYNSKIYITDFINDTSIRLHFDENNKDGFYFDNNKEIEFILTNDYNKILLLILFMIFLFQIIIKLYRNKKVILPLNKIKNINDKNIIIPNRKENNINIKY